MLVAAVLVLPSLPTTPGSRALAQARAAFAPRVLAVLGLALLIFAGLQSALTYLVPFLAEVSGVSGPVVSAYLLAYGVATTAGSYAGGRFADANAARALIVGSIGVAAALVGMRLLGAHPLGVALAVVGLGAFAMGMAPSLQHRVVTLAGPGAPLASSLPASAVNAGIAVGSLAGGAAITASGVTAAVTTGAVIAGVAVAAAWATSAIRPAADPALLPPSAELVSHR